MSGADERVPNPYGDSCWDALIDRKESQWLRTCHLSLVFHGRIGALS